MGAARQQSTAAIHDSGAFLTADNLAKLMSIDADQIRKQLADWQDRGEIFSVQDGAEGDLFPVFALENSHGLRVLDAIPKVLRNVQGTSISVGNAAWFVGLSSFLDDQLPKDLLEEDPDWVVDAALNWVSESGHLR